MSYIIRTHIEIDAPVERIWEILIDLDRYHEWNPFITNAKGRIAPDATFEVSPVSDSGKRHVFVPQVTDYQEYREFTWTGEFYFRWLALGDHTFRLTGLEHGRVRLDHDEKIYGLAAPLVYRMSKDQVLTGFKAMNAALKVWAEDAVADQD